MFINIDEIAELILLEVKELYKGNGTHTSLNLHAEISKFTEK